MMRILACVVLLFTARGDVFAQVSDSALPIRSGSMGDVVAGTFVLSTAGAALGMLGGAVAGKISYNVTGCCGEGGEDPGLGNILIGGFAGTIFGSASGAYIANRTHGVRFGKPLTASLGAIIPAIGVGYLADKLFPEPAALVGVTIGQGAFTTLFTLLGASK